MIVAGGVVGVIVGFAIGLALSARTARPARPGIHLLDSVHADPDVLPPSAAVLPPPPQEDR